MLYNLDNFYHIYGDLETATVYNAIEIVPCVINSSGKPNFVCTRGFTEAKWGISGMGQTLQNVEAAK